MKGSTAVAKILKMEGVEFVTGFPANALFETGAIEGIRPIKTRTERVAAGIADGFTRASFGQRNGVCVIQATAGIENVFAGVAQAFDDSVPVLFLPGGSPRRVISTLPSFSAVENFRGITKWVASISFADQVPVMMRRAFTYLRTGRPGPVMLELPADVAAEEFDDKLFQYEPIKGWKIAGDLADVKAVAKALIAAKNPVICAGNGILYASAWDELREFAELLQIPVFTTTQGKSAFPENHPLSLGTGGGTRPKMVIHFLNKADLVFAIGSSLTKHFLSTPIPDGKVIMQSTIDERDINKDYPVEQAIIGDAKLVLRQLIDEVKEQIGPSGKKNNSTVAKENAAVKDEWLKEWMPKLTSDEVPINPYRVIWALNNTLDKEKSIVIAESGGPRDQSMPFYAPTVPGGFIGWGKTTILGASLGFAMGAKLANPDKIVVNILGDAGIGMVGIDAETAVREKIPILSIVLNNSRFGGYERMMPTATKLYNIDRVGGDYTKVYEGLGFHAERIEQPGDIIPAIKRAQGLIAAGTSVFLEIITRVDTDFSQYMPPRM